MSLPTPYWTSEDGRLVIYHGDCREILPFVEADVTITDPPYGIGLVTKTSDYRDSTAYDAGESMKASILYSDEPEEIKSLIREVMPLILATTERAVVFPGPAMLWEYPAPRSLGGVFTMAGAGRTAWGFQCLHPVLFYGKDPFLVDGKGGRPNSLKDDQPNREHFDHPCPKPLGWMKWAVNRASREGEVVIDPFMGTGTTLRAAADLGRKAIGIEREQAYCDIAIERLRQGVLL
jgi:site-specific DNA-methyltransferase (adenine-specific)